MAFEFIKDLNESRIFSSRSNFGRYSLREVANGAFLYFLTIQILRNELEYKNKIKQYSYSVIQYQGYDNYKSTGNDLYQFLYILKNAEELSDELKNEGNNLRLAKRIRINKLAIHQWLNNVYKPIHTSIDHRFLYDLEQSLVITDYSYKAIRRMVEEWPDLTTDQRQHAITRLLQALRYKYARSELLPWIDDYSRRRGYELKGVDNAETGEKGKSLTLATAASKYNDLYKDEVAVKTGINKSNKK